MLFLREIWGSRRRELITTSKPWRNKRPRVCMREPRAAGTVWSDWGPHRTGSEALRPARAPAYQKRDRGATLFLVTGSLTLKYKSSTSLGLGLGRKSCRDRRGLPSKATLSSCSLLPCQHHLFTQETEENTLSWQTHRQGVTRTNLTQEGRRQTF